MRWTNLCSGGLTWLSICSTGLQRAGSVRADAETHPKSNPNFLQSLHKVDHLCDWVSDNPDFWWLDHQRMEVLQVEMAGRQMARPIIAPPPLWSYLCVHLLRGITPNPVQLRGRQPRSVALNQSGQNTSTRGICFPQQSPTWMKGNCDSEIITITLIWYDGKIRCHPEYQL